MPKFKKNLLNPYAYRDFQNDPSAYLSYMLDRVYTSAEESSFVITDTESFDAICLSGIRTENNVGSGQDKNDAKLVGDFLTIKIKPKNSYGNQYPNLSLYRDPDKINFMIDAMDEQFVATSDFLYDGTDGIHFGQVVKCYRANNDPDNPIILFKKPSGSPQFEPGYLELMGIEGFEPARASFSKGLPGLLGDPNNLSSNKPAQEAFEKQLEQAIKAKGLKFYVTDRSRTVDDQVKRIMNKYSGNGPGEVIKSYKNGKAMVAAIESGNQAQLKSLAAGSSRHLKGNAIDIRSHHYNDSEMTIVLAEIRKLGGNPLVEPLSGKCWEKHGRGVTNTKRLGAPGGKKGQPCYNEHIHIDIPENFK